jgi:hypothetical protein
MVVEKLIDVTIVFLFLEKMRLTLERLLILAFQVDSSLVLKWRFRTM